MEHPVGGEATDARTSVEETLDPTTDAEWEAVRALGHRMVDQVVALHRYVGTQPAWRPVPAASRQVLRGPLEPGGAPLDRAVADFEEHVLPYHLGNIHPRGWGWVNGTGTTLGALADLMASALNVNCAGASTGARYVEEQVVDTLKEALGWPAAGSGVLTSGASVANLVGLAAARGRAVAEMGAEAGRIGLPHVHAALTVYTSVAAHNSVDRAVRLLGIGTDQLRKIPVDDEGRMDLAALEEALAEDAAQGFHPACVVATAGTVDRGAVDPLRRLADLCARERVWLHVDGAFGAVAALAPELRPLVAGMERADSLAFDLHKWMHVPIEAGCVLVRDPEDHRRPFSVPAAYLRKAARGIAGTEPWMSDYGPQLTRGYRALKSWFYLKHYGTAKLGRLVVQNVRQTRELEALLRAQPRLQVLASGPLCVLCFRYVAEGLDGPALDAFNEELLADIQESGRAQLSGTAVDGAFALRLAITNHRTRREDLAAFVADVVALGDRRRAAGTLA